MLPRWAIAAVKPARAKSSSYLRCHGGHDSRGVSTHGSPASSASRSVAAAGERVALGHDGGDRLAQHALRREVADLGRPGEAGVERALAQAGDEPRDRQVQRLERDPRVALAEGADDRRHDVVGDAGQEPHPEVPDLTARRAAHRLRRTVGLGEHRPRLAQEHLAGRGQRDAAPAALEQHHAELRLERAHLLRERLLRDVQPARGGGQAARLGDRHEGAQLPQVGRGHRAESTRASQAVPVTAQADRGFCGRACRA